MRGFVLVALLALIATGVLAYLVTSLAPEAIDAYRTRRTNEALAEAREALIGYALKYRDMEGPTVVYGYLPLPDLGTSRNNNVDPNCRDALNNPVEGCDAANFAGNTVNTTVIGRFPWRALGTGPLRDSHGECLWLAVSGSHQRKQQVVPMNWDTTGQLDVLAANGSNALIPITASAHDRPVAVIFSPGPPLPAQSHSKSATDDVTQCGGNYDAANYLDPGTAGALAGLANYFGGSTNSASGDTSATAKALAIHGDIHRRNDGTLWSNGCPTGANCNVAANDAGLPLTADLLFDSLRKSSNFRTDINSMLDRMVGCLRDRIAAGGAFTLPFGKIPTDTCYDDTQAPLNYFTHWRDLVFAATGSLTVNGAACPGVLIFANQRSSGQSRITVADKANVSNYLEGITAATTTITGDALFNTIASGQSRQQDIVRCLPGTPSFVAVQSPTLTALGFGQLADYDPVTRTLTLGKANVTTGTGAPGGALFGCAWQPEANDLGKGFSAYFQVRFRQLGTGVGNNGFVFAVADAESNGSSACGMAGTHLGYSGSNGVTPPLTFPKIGFEFDQGRDAGFSETGITSGRNDPCGTSGCGGSVGYNSHAAIVYWGHQTANAADAVTQPGADDNAHGLPSVGSQPGSPRPDPRNPGLVPGIDFVNLRGQASEGGDSYLYHVRVEVTPSRDVTGVSPELRKTSMRSDVWIERNSGTNAQLIAAMQNTTRAMAQNYPGYAAKLQDVALVYDVAGSTCGPAPSSDCPPNYSCGADNVCYRQGIRSVRLGFTGSQRTQDQRVEISKFFASWLQ